MGEVNRSTPIMRQIRIGVRAYLALDPTPQKVLEALDGLALGFEIEELVTLAYGQGDPDCVHHGSGP